ncbi:MAG: MerR family transcriptional regulator [Pseudomonadota bacterium]
MSPNDSVRSYKIGELAKLSGLSVRTIRGYEEMGIISSVRSDGGTRYYSEAGLKIAKLAHRMRALNIPVTTIQDIATRRRDFDTGDLSSAAMTEILESLSDELRRQAARMLELEDEVMRTLRLIRGCRGCRNLPSAKTCPDCPMEMSDAKTDLSQMIWQDS